MESKLKTLLTSTPSDSHTWNLIYMELFLQENNCQVYNLGACTPITDLYDAIYKFQPKLVVISSINGHLFQDAIEIIENLKDRENSFCCWWETRNFINFHSVSKEKIKTVGL